MAQYRATRVLDDAQAPMFEAACTALCDTLAPYIADCLSQVWQSGCYCRQKSSSVPCPLAAVSILL